MKKFVLAILPLLTFVLCLSLANASGVIKKNATYEGEMLTISLYNGRECETAKVVMQTSGTTTLAYFQIKVEWDTPSGHHRENKFSAHPGKRYTHEVTICMEGDNAEPGTGVLRVACGWDEVLYTEFAFDGRYVKFGESYKPEPKVDINVEPKVEINVPERPAPREEPKGTSSLSVFNITSIPSPADLYIDGNWVGNTPATVELPAGQHKVVVKKNGYKDWEKDLNISMKGKFSLCAELEKMSEEEIGEIQRKIVFESNSSHHPWDIYIMNSDGSQLKSLTADSENQGRSPSWSPDGKKIVFSSWGPEDECWNIYTMNVDGSELKRLTNNSAWDDAPSWSPDGKKIVFTSIQKPLEGGFSSRNQEIYIMNANGGGVKRLTNNSVRDGNPSWSPDGKRIVFESESGIYVMNPDGNEVKLLAGGAGSSNWNPSWSPDGKKIVFVSDRDDLTQSEVYIMNADGSRPMKLTHDPKMRAKDGKIYWRNLTPSWSPNGKRIVFSSNRNNGVREIYVMNADGSGQTRLSNTPGDDYRPSWCPNL